ncbi:MAG: hypothetical protein WKF57_19155 [Nakamurella sp.]
MSPCTRTAISWWPAGWVCGPQPTDGSGLADAGTVRDLLEDLGPTDWFSVTTGAGACIAPDVGAAMIESKDAAEKYLATLNTAGRRHPVTGVLVAVTADDAGSIRSTYTDDAAAAADQPVRTKLLQTLDSQVSRHPYSQLLTATLTTNGSKLDYDVSARPSTLISMVENRDLPWAFC